MINTSLFTSKSTSTAIAPAPLSRLGASKELKIFDVRYIGWVKRRADGTQMAFGWCNGQWSVVFNKSVLHEFFGLSENPSEAATLYTVLCCKQDATAEEIKTAYRRMAKQWHPDRCKEMDARTQFDAIQQAYNVLSNQIKRAKYNAGLTLMAKTEKVAQVPLAYAESDLIYRSPLRCGLILAECNRTGGKYTVTKIIQWNDIVDSNGKTLVTSWPRGAENFTEDWV